MQPFKYKPKTNTGKLRQRITFLKPPGEKDVDGFPTTEWTPYVTVWAELKTLKGRSFYEAAKVNLENSREFKIRYRKDLNENMRIRWREQDHDLAAPIENEDGMNEYMRVIVKAVTS